MLAGRLGSEPKIEVGRVVVDLANFSYQRFPNGGSLKSSTTASARQPVVVSAQAVIAWSSPHFDRTVLS
jgi:hypothetical protein